MEAVLFTISEDVGIIKLNRPDKFNSFNTEMAHLLQQRLDECSENKSIRCVYITGTGKAFSAGQDIGELTGENPLAFTKILSENFNPIIHRLRHLEKPVVAAVNGVAAGAGANIALCCDVVVASANASFIQAFSKIGLIPDSGGTFFLPRLIGLQKASAIMMLGDKVSAKEAADMGMIYKYFESDVFESESFAIAKTLAQLPTKGLAYTKEALNQSLQNNLSDQLQLEDKLQYKSANTKDYNEGIAAFMGKREAKFTGE
ncbi:MAG: enoyl-CoA hydratase-related protein [Ferruginibacter sp.]